MTESLDLPQNPPQIPHKTPEEQQALMKQKLLGTLESAANRCPDDDPLLEAPVAASQGRCRSRRRPGEAVVVAERVREGQARRRESRAPLQRLHDLLRGRRPGAPRHGLRHGGERRRRVV